MELPVKKINWNESGRNMYVFAEKSFFVAVQLIYFLFGKPHYTIALDSFIFPTYAFEIKQNSNTSRGNVASLNLCGEKKSILTSSWPIS